MAMPAECFDQPRLVKSASDRAGASGAFTWTRVAIWVMVVLAAALIRLPHLTESLWYDEVWRTNVVLRGWDLKRLLLHDVHNPLYNLLMLGWTAVMGDSELSVRTPSLLAGLGVIVVLSRWVGARFGGRSGAICAMLLLVSPVHAWYSCEAKNNMFVVFFGVLLVVRIDSLLRRPGWTGVVMCTLWATLAVLTSWQALLVVIPAWIAAYVLAGRACPGEDTLGQDISFRRRLRAMLWLTAASTLVLLTPLIIFKAGRVEELQRWYTIPFDLASLAKLLLIWFPTGNALVKLQMWPLWAMAFGLLVVPAMVLGVRALRGSRAGLLVLACTLLPLLGLLLISWGSMLIGIDPPRIYQERNVLVILPWYTVIVAVGAARARPLPGALAAMLVALSLASSIAAVTWRAGKPTIMNPNPDWRAAASFIKARSEGSGRPPVVISCCPLLPLSYYLPEAVHIQIDWNADVAALVQAHREQHPSEAVFFINNPCWFGHPEDQLAGLEGRLGHIDFQKVRSLQVYRLGHPSPSG